MSRRSGTSYTQNKHIIGTPGIDYEDDLKGEDGVLLPGKDVRVKDGTSFSWTPSMSRKDRLTAFGQQAGFVVEVESDVVRAVRVPCLLAGGVVGTCTIETSYDSASGQPDKRMFCH